VHEVREEARQRRRQHHALVAERVLRERDDVELGHLGEPALGAAPGQEQVAFETRDVERVGRGYEHLLDARQVALRLRAALGEPERHLAPTRDGEAERASSSESTARTSVAAPAPCGRNTCPAA
jgi:hypothetical protein